MSFLAACQDPAFLICLHRAASNRRLLSRFNCRAGCSFDSHGAFARFMANDAADGLADDFLSFAEFVYDTVYLSLEPSVSEHVRKAVLGPGADQPSLLFPSGAARWLGGSHE